MADVVLRMESAKKPINYDHLAQALKQVSGVTAVHIDTEIGQAAVSYQPHKVDTFALVTAVQDAGYIVQTQTIPLLVGGMSCASCVFHVESALTDVPGVIEADVNLQSGETAVIVVNKFVNLEQLHQAVEEAGYQICGLVSDS